MCKSPRGRGTFLMRGGATLFFRGLGLGWKGVRLLIGRGVRSKTGYANIKVWSITVSHAK